MSSSPAMSVRKLRLPAVISGVSSLERGPHCFHHSKVCPRRRLGPTILPVPRAHLLPQATEASFCPRLSALHVKTLEL